MLGGIARRAGPLALVVVTGLGWGLLAVGSKVLFAAEPAVFNGTTVALARGLWSLPFFLFGLGVAWRLEPPKLDARRWLLILAAGIVFGPGVSLLYTLAAQHTSVAHITFLLGVSPVTNTAAAALVFRKALDRRSWLALALGVAGIVLLALTRRAEGASPAGDLLMLGWLVTFAAYACLLRAVGAGISSTLLMCLVGTIAMIALVVPQLAASVFASAHVADTPALAWWFFGEIILGSTLVAQTTYAAAVRRLGVAVATIGTEYTALVVGIVASLLSREAWTPLTALAAAAFCSALAVTFVPSRRRLKARRSG
ncbi:MAG TPA: DMT family transporter [Candidatus Limnocylindria bacterium]|jgi:drug/metabolite transporter (DMT)-like permease|nr:DMT family transporter [Candidatus Limnocylindria bacterium]